MHPLTDRLTSTDGWDIVERTCAGEDLIATGSNFLVGNGYLGYRGSFPEWRREQYTGCFVSDTYDKADGKWTELCNAPNALYNALVVDGEAVTLARSGEEHRRRLDLRSGTLTMEKVWQGLSGTSLEVVVSRFASYADRHLLPQRLLVRVDRDCCLELKAGIDTRVWDLNGSHFRKIQTGCREEGLYARALATESSLELYVLQGLVVRGRQPCSEQGKEEDGIITRHLVFNLEAGEELVLETMMVVYSTNDCARPFTAAQSSLREALRAGYKQLLYAHERYWDYLWKRADISIEGDTKAQALVRFNIYHNIIATPLHSDRLPVGARGLSCQAYQGAAFWDQELFNMPMFTWTMPEAARRLLTYRYHTLDGARTKANNLGFRGAYYAWVSGKSGHELCPSFFFTDVLSGRKMRNHFNDWQIHISPDIVYAIDNYFQVTGDWAFICDYGAEIIFEVARFLFSRACYRPDEDRYHLMRVIGPDEYHENVDNNAFTNYQAKFSLEKALEVARLLRDNNSRVYRRVVSRIKLDERELLRWRDMAEKLFLPRPHEHSRLIEQFSGFFALENISPQDLAGRIIHSGEYWGWPNGVAVHTRVAKQADVLHLLALHNLFDEATVRANYRFYEPLCQHGSSLSLAIHALVAARLGERQEAYDYFLRSSLVDLAATNKAVSGNTFIGGIHTAACGAAWQVVVFGFCGLHLAGGEITFCPRFPAHWRSVSFTLSRGGRLYRYNIQARGRNDRSGEESRHSPPGDYIIKKEEEPDANSPGGNAKGQNNRPEKRNGQKGDGSGSRNPRLSP